MRYHLSIAVSLMLSAPLEAATLIVDGNGELVGATGVDVAGAMYDVSFTDGTCASLFNGCDESTDFIFDQTQSQAAAQALLDQVFIDETQGAFDTQYDLTFGCEINSSLLCVAAIPYDTNGSFFSASAALNRVGTDSVSGAGGSIAVDFSNSAFTWARFTPMAFVPEPSTWAIILLGFGATGFQMRRRTRVLSAGLPQVD